MFQVFKSELPKYMYGIAFILLLVFILTLGFEYLDDRDLAYAGNQPTTPPSGVVSIVIKVNSRILEGMCRVV